MNDLEEELRSTLRAKTALVSQTMLRTLEVPAVDGSDRVIQLPAPNIPAPRHRRLQVTVGAAAAAAVALVVGLTAAHGSHPRAAKRVSSASTSASSSATPTGSATQTVPPFTYVPPPPAQTDPNQNWAVIVVPSQSAPTTAPATVYKVSPTGQRTPVAQVGPAWRLVSKAWNYNADRVVLENYAAESLELLDLHTGQQTPVPLHLPAPLGARDFENLLGENLLMFNLPAAKLYLVSPQGAIVTTFPSDELATSEVPSPDGTQLAAGDFDGMVVFDAASGKVVHRWSEPPGRTGCGPLAWLPGDSVIQGRCDPVPANQSDRTVFPLNGSTPSNAALPNGWATLRLPNGTIAFHAAKPAEYDTQIGPVDTTEIAQVDAAGKLHPITAPAALHGWTLGYENGGLTAVRGDTPFPTAVATWNPISGQLSTYYDGDSSLNGYAVWGG